MNPVPASNHKPHAEEIRTQGYTVYPGFLDNKDLQKARETLDRIFEREEDKGHNPGERLTDSHQISFMLVAKSRFFRRLCFHPGLQQLCTEMLGPGFILSAMNGLSVLPGGKRQPLHIDQDESTPGMIVSLQCVIALDPFTKDNGATRLLPGSQDKIWTRDADIHALEPDAFQLEVPAGSAIIYNGGLLHGGSANQTGISRRALHFYFSRPWVTPHWEFEDSFPEKLKRQLSHDEKRLFAWYAKPRKCSARHYHKIKASDPTYRSSFLMQPIRRLLGW